MDVTHRAVAVEGSLRDLMVGGKRKGGIGCEDSRKVGRGRRTGLGRG